MQWKIFVFVCLDRFLSIKVYFCELAQCIEIIQFKLQIEIDQYVKKKCDSFTQLCPKQEPVYWLCVITGNLIEVNNSKLCPISNPAWGQLLQCVHNCL